MSLLDSIMNANNHTGAPYMQAGRTLIKVSRVVLRDSSAPGADKAAGDAFFVDGQVLHTTSEHESQPKVGEVGRVQSPGKYPDQTARRAKSGILAMLTSKTGKVASEKSFGLEGEPTPDQIKAEIDRLTGPSQPLAGAIVAVSGVQKPGKKYTVFEIEVPTEIDLKNAGI